MSTNLKYTFSVFVLISLCFFIKCKSDSDKDLPTEQKKSHTSNLHTELDSKVEKTAPRTSPKDIQLARPSGEPNQVTDTPTKTKEPSTKSKEPSRQETTSIKKKATKTQKPKPKTQKKPVKKRNKKTAKPSPIIEFEQMMWDFGEITEGDIIKKKFKFTNTGKAPLQIIGADASCGCARPTVPFLNIAPGESSEIGITYNSVNKDGDQEPEIVIESNTHPKYNVLKLFGTVKPKPEVANEINLDSIEAKQDSTTKN